MKRMSVIYVALFVLLMTGCASTPQSPVTFDNSFWSSETEKRIAVVMRPPPNPTVVLPGADCLLCIAAARAMNSSLIDHFESLSTEDVDRLKKELVETLNSRGANAKVIDAFEDLENLPKFQSDVPNAADKDFSVFKSKFNATHVLVVQVTRMGVIRSYASYVPTSPPAASLIATAYLVDASTNTYDWYLPLTLTRNADGEWDEPPNFPGLTNAYYQVLANAREQLLLPFSY